MSATSYGHDRERKVRKVLEAEGWFVIRAPASLGFADLVALKLGDWPKMVEVKGNAGSPFMHFRPEHRAELLRVADRAGAEAVLAHWPPRGTLSWIAPEDWPAMPNPYRPRRGDPK